jgi:hypothetical protein
MLVLVGELAAKDALYHPQKFIGVAQGKQPKLGRLRKTHLSAGTTGTTFETEPGPAEAGALPTDIGRPRCNKIWPRGDLGFQRWAEMSEDFAESKSLSHPRVACVAWEMAFQCLATTMQASSMARSPLPPTHESVLALCATL